MYGVVCAELSLQDDKSTRTDGGLHSPRSFRIDPNKTSASVVEPTVFHFACDESGLRIGARRRKGQGGDDGHLLMEQMPLRKGVHEGAFDPTRKVVVDVFQNLDAEQRNF